MTSVSNVTSVGQATTTVVAKGVVVGVSFVAGATGAAAEGRGTAELALNNTVNSNAEVASGAPSDNLLGRISASYGVGTSANESLFIPLSVPVTFGNQLCINTTFAGTAPARAFWAVDVFVKE